jgi:hypothetical protein
MPGPRYPVDHHFAFIRIAGESAARLQPAIPINPHTDDASPHGHSIQPLQQAGNPLSTRFFEWRGCIPDHMPYLICRQFSDQGDIA